MKIGIFDSGIGGLSVLHQALKYLPDQQFLYFADEANVPYGEKTKREIIGYVDDAIAFLVEQGAEAIVVACNTATSVAITKLRAKYSIPIVGMEPAIKKALDLYGEHRVLVAATPITVRGEKLHGLMERVDRNHLVDLIPLPMLVRSAERGVFESEAITDYIQDMMKDYRLDDYSSMVLGCTHFNYFKKVLRTLLPDHIRFVDGNEGTIRQLMRETGLQGTETTMTPAGLEKRIYQIRYYESKVEVTSPERLRLIQSYMEWLEDMSKIA